MTKSSEDLNKYDSISKRLKYVIDTLGVKQSHMAQKLGLSPSGLHYILNTETKFSKNAKKIAEYLQINEDWLMTGKGEIYTENTTVKTYKIPLYFPDQLKLFYRSSQRIPIETNNYFISATPYPNSALGIYVTESNFSPKFEVSDILVFEASENFKEGEIILAYASQSNQIIFGYAYSLPEAILLVSPNGPPQKLFTTCGDILIGAYKECSKKAN